MPGSYAPEVYPGSVDYPSTVVTTEPASGAIAAGGNFTVTAILRDAYGNVVPGGDDLSTLFVGPSGQLLPATSVDRGNGTLAFQVQMTTSRSQTAAAAAPRGPKKLRMRFSRCNPQLPGLTTGPFMRKTPPASQQEASRFGCPCVLC